MHPLSATIQGGEAFRRFLTIPAPIRGPNGGSYNVVARVSRCSSPEWGRCSVPQSRLKHHDIGGMKGECATSYVMKRDKAFLVNAAAEESLESEPGGAFNDSKSGSNTIVYAMDAFYRFSRPHTIIGTVKYSTLHCCYQHIVDLVLNFSQLRHVMSTVLLIFFPFIIYVVCMENSLSILFRQALSIVSVSLLAVQNLSDISPLFFTRVLEAVIAALFMNIYIVGLNQLSDIDIDKVNKPYLPLASGEYSIVTGIMIVTSFVIMSFWLGWLVGSWPLFWALFISFVLGTAYSINVPLLRWKRSAVVAAMCILAVRAVIVQLAFFLHIQTHVYKRPAAFSRPVIFATAFMSFFSVVIALFKDIPDIDGDKIFGIRSFTVRLGQERVFWICIWLLQMAYGVAILVGASSSFMWSKCITVLGHAILAFILWSRAKSIDLTSKTAITAFYMFIWKLFYAEYLLIPLVR